MIELNKHIEILLLSNDCVIVPNLGGFMTHHCDAHYDERDSNFLPPLRTLGFNSQLKMNDSLLVQAYIEAYDISYPEALRRIEAEVEELKQHLETDGLYVLNDIGTLRLNDEGQIQFEPCEAGILTPSLYGLSSFEMKPLSAIKALIPKKEEKQANNGNNPSADIITIKMSWIRNTAAAAAAFIAFMMISTPISNSNSPAEVQQSAFVALPQQHNTDAANNTSMQSSDMTEMSTSSMAKQMPAETAQDMSVEAAAKEPSYCIVLACNVARKNAEIFIEQLQKKDFKEARLLLNKKNMLRVVYGNYSSEGEATETLHSLRSQSKHFAQAWVMKIED